MRNPRSVAPILVVSLCLIGTIGCAPNPYVKAHTEYWTGDPVAARQTLQPKVDEALAKDDKNKNVLLWDMGLYNFYAGDYDKAVQYFMGSVQDKERINSGADDIKAALTSSASDKYVGDPVEIAVAYMYLGMSFIMQGDYENAMVALRRSLEEDLNKDLNRVGDLVITHMLMAAVHEATAQPDDAQAAFRAALEHNPDFVPAKAGLARLLRTVAPEDAERYLNEVVVATSADYAESLIGNPGPMVIVGSGQASLVKADAFLGAFRKRNEVGDSRASFRLNAPGVEGIPLFLADNMHSHLTSQGGLQNEAKQQVTRAVAAEAVKKIPLFGGLLAPDTSADLRSWVTMPGSYHIGFLPTGVDAFTLEPLDKKGIVMAKGIINRRVSDGRNSLLVPVSVYVKGQAPGQAPS